MAAFLSRAWVRALHSLAKGHVAEIVPLSDADTIVA
jgi:hypothetical protein